VLDHLVAPLFAPAARVGKGASSPTGTPISMGLDGTAAGMAWQNIRPPRSVEPRRRENMRMNMRYLLVASSL
jgi:hypothetical protein